jgi:hypothetical protein
MEALPIGDIIVSHLCGPFNTKAIPKRRHRQLAQVITCQLQGTLAANPGLRIVREGREAVHLLEHTQEELRGLDSLEAAEVLTQGVLIILSCQVPP